MIRFYFIKCTFVYESTYPLKARELIIPVAMHTLLCGWSGYQGERNFVTQIQKRDFLVVTNNSLLVQKTGSLPIIKVHGCYKRGTMSSGLPLRAISLYAVPVAIGWAFLHGSAAWPAHRTWSTLLWVHLSAGCKDHAAKIVFTMAMQVTWGISLHRCRTTPCRCKHSSTSGNWSCFGPLKPFCEALL